MSTASSRRCWPEPGHMWSIPVLTRCRTASHTASPVGQKPQDLLVCLFSSMPASEAQQEDLWPRRGERAMSQWGRADLGFLLVRGWFMVNRSLKCLK